MESFQKALYKQPSSTEYQSYPENLQPGGTEVIHWSTQPWSFPDNVGLYFKK